MPTWNSIPSQSILQRRKSNQYIADRINHPLLVMGASKHPDCHSPQDYRWRPNHIPMSWYQKWREWTQRRQKEHVYIGGIRECLSKEKWDAVAETLSTHYISVCTPTSPAPVLVSTIRLVLDKGLQAELMEPKHERVRMGNDTPGLSSFVTATRETPCPRWCRYKMVAPSSDHVSSWLWRKASAYVHTCVVLSPWSRNKIFIKPCWLTVNVLLQHGLASAWLKQNAKGTKRYESQHTSGWGKLAWEHVLNSGSQATVQTLPSLVWCL